jgi:hypothetical protein
MATRSKDTPDLFADTSPDPVESATGYQGPSPSPPRPSSTDAKKKAGFYLSVDVLERFTLKFHELKLAGMPIDNKSTLLELVLAFGLDDMDKGNASRLLQKLQG